MVKLFLMSQKGFDILNHLVGKGYKENISCVISSKDKSVVYDYYDEIKNTCISEKIKFYDRNEDCSDDFRYQIAISWRWLIKNDRNLIVLHDSLLPKYRGFAPLVNSLKNGENKIGVTAIFANDEYDMGDIIVSSSVDIEYPLKIKDAIEKISLCYNECVDSIFRKISKNDKLDCSKQINEDATYSLWLDDLDYKIDWSKDSTYLKRFVDAVGWPYLGAYTHAANQKYIIIDVDIVKDILIENRTPGKVIFFDNERPVVVCGSGLLRINKMKLQDGDKEIYLKKFRTRFE